MLERREKTPSAAPLLLKDKTAAKPRCDDGDKGSNLFLLLSFFFSVYGCSVGPHICYAFIHVNI